VFEQIVPKQGYIVDAGCGYGFLTYTLAMRSSQRQLLGVDYDADKIATAQNIYICNEKTEFVCADITCFEFPQADCFVLSDVLHYVAFEQTEKIMTQLSAKLNAGGVIIVRDADTKEHIFNKTAEYFSTQVFRFNKAQQYLSFFSSETLCSVMRDLGFSVEKIHDRKKTINTLLIFRKR
jgi:trans-aconitate methyltransferase